MDITMQTLKTNVKRGLVAVAAAGSSAAVNAADYTGQLGTASTEANANQTAVILAVIGIAILGFGVTALLGFMKK